MPIVETFRGVAFPWLCDQMGHLTTSRYVEMFDVASYHLFWKIGLEHDAEGQFGLADVRQEIDYSREVPLGALVLIRSGVLEVGRSSIRCRHVMSGTDGLTVHAVLEAVTVRFDLHIRKSVALPGEVSGLAQDCMIREDNNASRD